MEKFGPEAGETWIRYLRWRHPQHLESFDSVDSVLRPDCFVPQTEEDWENCVQEDCKTSLISSLAYARKVQQQFPNSELVGVEIAPHAGYRPGEGLLGFDIIDESCSNSLISNWGNDSAIFAQAELQTNGLLSDLETARALRDSLRRKYPDDDHARACEVWAIYSVDRLRGMPGD